MQRDTDAEKDSTVSPLCDEEEEVAMVVEEAEIYEARAKAG